MAGMLLQENLTVGFITVSHSLQMLLKLETCFVCNFRDGP